jgi:N-acetylmuramoyl-L-alanine amidase
MSVPYRVEKVDRVEIPQVVQSVSEPQVTDRAQVETPKPVKKEVNKVETTKKAEPVKKEVKKAEPVKKEKSVDHSKTDAPVFKIQIMAGRNELPVTAPYFKGVSGIEKIKDGDMYKYYVGANTDYNSVNRKRKELNETFPGCYIVAFKHGKQVNVNEAIKEFLKSKNK